MTVSCSAGLSLARCLSFCSAFHSWGFETLLSLFLTFICYFSGDCVLFLTKSNFYSMFFCIFLFFKWILFLIRYISLGLFVCLFSFAFGSKAFIRDASVRVLDYRAINALKSKMVLFMCRRNTFSGLHSFSVIAVSAWSAVASWLHVCTTATWVWSHTAHNWRDLFTGLLSSPNNKKYNSFHWTPVEEIYIKKYNKYRDIVF